jgi:hypothetical protein
MRTLPEAEGHYVAHRPPGRRGLRRAGRWTRFLVQQAPASSNMNTAGVPAGMRWLGQSERKAGDRSSDPHHHQEHPDQSALAGNRESVAVAARGHHCGCPPQGVWDMYWGRRQVLSISAFALSRAATSRSIEF